MGTTFLQSPIISILRTLFVLKIAVFLHCVILLQTISDFHAFHKIFNNSQTKEKNSPHKIQKSCKTLFFRIKLASVEIYVEKVEIRAKKSQATSLRANKKRRNDDKGGGIDRKQYNTVSCLLLYHKRL